MKHFAILGLMLATPIAALATHHIATAEASKQPVQVEIKLNGFTIQSSLTTFSPGVPYRFSVWNAASVKHDWAIMPKGETDLRKAIMAIEEDNLQPNQVAVTPVVTFDQAGEYEFACHFRNHYEKGMKTIITVQ